MGRSGAGLFTERVVILSRSLAAADDTGEEVESWPTPTPVGTAEHWCSIEGSGGSETTDATRGSYRTLSVRFRHLVTIRAVDRVRFLETGEVFRVQSSYRERNPDNRQMQTVCTLSAIGEGDVTAPTLVSATIDSTGAVLTLVFSEEVVGTSSFTLAGDNGSSTATYSSGTGSTTFTYTLSQTIYVNDTPTLSYTPGSYADWAGNALAAFSGAAVTNNTTVYFPPDALTGPDLWMSSAYGAYTDAGGTTPATTGQGLQSWRNKGPTPLLLGLSSYGSGHYGQPVLQSDNGYPVVDSRTAANGPAALFANLAASWTPTNISCHVLAKMRPGSTERIQTVFGFNDSAGVGTRYGPLWNLGGPILSDGNGPADTYSAWCADGSYHLLSYVREGANARFYLDGAPIKLTSADGTTISAITQYWVFGISVNDQDSALYFADGWTYQAAHSDDEVSKLAQWCLANRSLIYPKTTTPSPDIFAYFIGNSIWTTAFTLFPCIPTRVSTGQTDWSRWLNASLGAQATNGGGTSNGPGMIARIATEYGPILAGRPEATKVAIIHELVNDIVHTGADAATAYAHYVTLAQGLKANGASKVMAITGLPQAPLSNTTRAAANALVVANADGAFDYVCQAHLDPYIGVDGVNTDTTYFQGDFIHLNTTGADVMTAIMRPALQSMLGTFNPGKIAPLIARFVASPTYCFSDAAGTVPCGNGDLVYVWKDCSGNNYHVSQATSGSRPTLVLSGGLWRVRGTGSKYLFNTSLSPTISNTSLSFAAAMVPSVATGSTFGFFRLRDSSAGDAMNSQKTAAGKMRGIYTTSSGALFVDSAASATSGVPASFLWSVDANSRYIHSFNTVQIAGTLAGTKVTRAINTIDVVGDSSQEWDSDVFELACYSTALNCGSIPAIEAYFRSTYGTP